MAGKRKSTNYINNADLYLAMKEFKTARNEAVKNGTQLPQIPRYVGEAIMLIANNLARKGNFSGYSFRSEMVSDGIENCFHRDTKILTLEHGPAPISSLVGKKLTVKCKDGIWRPAAVQSFGKQELYTYQFGAKNSIPTSLVQKVIATKNHRWFITTRRNKFGSLHREDQAVTDLRLGDQLQTVPNVTDVDNEGVIHGLIFGDGCVEKKTVQYGPKLTTTQGREYPFIRVCKQDSVQSEIENIFEKAGYVPTFPPSSKGDPVYYLGRKLFQKQLPFTNDPAYVAGFIHGWWLADGSKTYYQNRLMITTTTVEAIDWIRDYAAYGGYQFIGVRTAEHSKGSFPNGKQLYQVTLAKNEDYNGRVRDIEYFGDDEVFCVVEPETNSFTLANGLLTGNCIMYLHNFNPDKSKNPFGYISLIISRAFVRRIEKEAKHSYIRHKLMVTKSPFYEAFDLDPSDMEAVSAEMSNDKSSDIITNFEKKLANKKEKKRIKDETDLLDQDADGDDD
jgi:hypothetical protein